LFRKARQAAAELCIGIVVNRGELPYCQGIRRHGDRRGACEVERRLPTKIELETEELLATSRRLIEETKALIEYTRALVEEQKTQVNSRQMDALDRKNSREAREDARLQRSK
jgi:hypothetical protein